ncbi:Multidrug resistance protein MdtG [subsurface metagenome]
MRKFGLTRRYSALLYFLVVAHFSHHLLTALLVPLIPFIRDDFSLDYAHAGLLVTAFTVAYGISQLPAGWLADRIGQHTLITIGISGVAVSGLLIGLASNYVALAVLLILLGIMAGGYHPAAVPLVSASVTPESRGRALGIHQIGGSASYFVTPLIAVALAGVVGWRGAFIGLAIPVIILGLILYALLSRQRYQGRIEEKVEESKVNKPSILGNRKRLLAFLTLAIVSEMAIWAIIAFIPLFLVDQSGVGEETAGILLALVYSGGIWAAPLGGYLCDRWGRVPMIIATSVAAGLVIYLLTLVAYGWAMLALFVALGMSAFFLIPISEAYLITRAPAHNRSTILGIYYVGSIGGPGFIAPLIGYFIDRSGFDISFTMVGATLIAITLGCSVFLWRDRG